MTEPESLGSDQAKPAGHWPITLGVVILLLAVGTRFIGLGDLDPWGDEVYSHMASSELIHQLLHWKTPGNESSSPLPFLEIKVVRQIFGKNDWALRVPTALHGVASVVGLYLVVGWLAGWRTGFWSALMLALNPFALQWSREARMYSQWLFFSIVLIGLAHCAVIHARSPQRSALDWRWWLLGMVMMLVHASNVLAVTTIAAVGGWLGLMALVELGRDRAAGWTVLGGSALAGVVYLNSWALTGLGKILMLMGHDGPPGPSYVPPQFSDELYRTTLFLAGYLPCWPAVMFWLAAGGGLVVLVVRRRWALALLVLLVSLLPWATYPSVAKSHFYTARYIFPALIGLSVGVGALIHWVWGLFADRGALQAVARSVVMAGLLAVCVGWAPAWKEIYSVHKMSIREALKPIVDDSVDGEVMMTVPDWHHALQLYYSFGDHVQLIRPPIEARDTPTPTNREAGENTGPYRGDFEMIFGPQADPDQPTPSAAWLFLVEPEKHLHKLRRILIAYELDDPKFHDQLESLARGAWTLTVRVSHQGFDHIVRTESRTMHHVAR